MKGKPFSTNFNSPCYNCIKRHRACHDSCEEYQKRKAEWRARGERYIKWVEIEHYAANVSVKAIDRVWRRHKQ